MNREWVTAHEPHARAKDIALFCEGAPYQSVGEHAHFGRACADSETGRAFTRAMVNAAVANLERLPR